MSGHLDPMTPPLPGDVLLIRATVIPQDPNATYPEDTAVVRVTCRTEQVGLIIRLSDVVAANTGPVWYPPQIDDAGLDRNGNLWQYVITPDHNQPVWKTHLDPAAAYSDEEHRRLFGPINLVVRGGELWEG